MESQHGKEHLESGLRHCDDCICLWSGVKAQDVGRQVILTPDAPKPIGPLMATPRAVVAAEWLLEMPYGLYHFSGTVWFWNE